MEALTAYLREHARLDASTEAGAAEKRLATDHQKRQARRRRFRRRAEDT
jgi:hypothetical protein